MTDEEFESGGWSDCPPEENAPVFKAKPYNARRSKKLICVADTETDPFKVDREVKPFTVGFYDGTDYVDFWGDDCIEQFFAYLNEHYSDVELIVYFHNFGRFDGFFMRDYLDEDQEPFIMNGSIVSAMYQGQEFRDSYRIIPVPLKAYKKDDMDYTKLERDVRDKHKSEILHYQKTDCLYLYDLVSAFQERFGDKLTMGSVSLPMLNSFHGYGIMNEDMDALIRPYYYGGRTQAFNIGIFKGSFKVYDVNSMYPDAMKNKKHPLGSVYSVDRYITPKTAFILCEGWSGGAFPVRGEDGGLDFPNGHGRYWVTMHEYEAAIETGSFSLDRIIHTRNCEEWGSFEEFIDFYYADRMRARAEGDTVTDLFDKLIMNASYGKFAQNPEKYESYEIRHVSDPHNLEDMFLTCTNEECAANRHKNKECTERKWYVHTEENDLVIWARKSTTAWRSYKNVAIAASITGAARASLLRGISKAKNPLYCDTDSLICEEFGGEISSSTLGAWKLEAEGHVVAIAGKKMYVVLSYDLEGEGERLFYEGREMRVIKKASKGVRLSGEEIIRVASGEIVEYKNPVPKFGLDGSVKFITRKVSRTG